MRRWKLGEEKKCLELSCQLGLLHPVFPIPPASWDQRGRVNSSETLTPRLTPPTQIYFPGKYRVAFECSSLVGASLPSKKHLVLLGSAILHLPSFIGQIFSRPYCVRGTVLSMGGAVGSGSWHSSPCPQELADCWER